MGHNSWVTQRLANRLPPWSDARKNPHSFLQQYLNPVGEALEELSTFSITQRKSLFLTDANLDIIDVTHAVHLPADFEFGYEQTRLTSKQYAVPLCKGYIGTDEYWISTADQNTMQSFWYDSVPTRITFSGAYVDVISVLEETALDALVTATINPIVWPTRLALTITGGTNFANLDRKSVFSFIAISGITARGLEEDEVVIIPYNGVFLTRKIWKEITEIAYFGLEPTDVATIQVDCFTFNTRREVDKFQLYVTDQIEKLLYHRLESHVFDEGTYSVHQHLTLTADTLGQLYQGVDTLEAVREFELLYNGSNLLLNDLAVQPFTGRMYALDDNYIYVFDAYPAEPDYRGMRQQTPGSMMTIETDRLEGIRGDIVTLEPFWRKQTERIIKNRWIVKKPDGTIVYLNIDGSESATSVWIYNRTYTELVFGPFTNGSVQTQNQRFEYELVQRGTYLFTLEVVYADSTVETSSLPVNVNSREALARLPLPTGLENCSGLAFDADQKLWLLKQEAGGSGIYEAPSGAGIHGRAFRIHLATDNMLVDFENKIIYLHEEYDSVDVTESDTPLVEM